MLLHRPFFSYVITYEFWIRGVGKFICNLHMNFVQKFTYEFICKFTYEFICHRFFGHEHPKCSHCDGSILSYAFLQKRSQVTKCSRPMTKFCLTNPYKSTLNSQNFRLRRLDFTFKPPQNDIQITKFFPLAWFYH